MYRRADKPIETTYELNDIIKAAIPAKMRATGGHPSKRTFQAIRIECNHELDVLKDSLDDMIDMLNHQGRLCIITFHSLEDRIVKNVYRQKENPCTCPPEFRCVYVVRHLMVKQHPENRFCQVQKRWKRIPGQRVPNSGYFERI